MGRLTEPFAEQTTPERGIEPPSTGLEAVVLPLDDSGIFILSFLVREKSGQQDSNLRELFASCLEGKCSGL